MKKKKPESQPKAEPPTSKPPTQRGPDGRWTKGFCPNRAGRPKKGQSLAEQLRHAVDGPPRRRIIKQLLTRAEAGHLPSIEMVLRYVVGVPRGAPIVAIDARSGETERQDLSRLSLEELRQLRYLMEKAAGQDVQPEANTEAVVIPPAEVIDVPTVLALPPAPEEAPEPAPVANVIPIDFVHGGFDRQDPDLLENQPGHASDDDLTRPSYWRGRWDNKL